jgi:hypothetical protein
MTRLAAVIGISCLLGVFSAASAEWELEWRTVGGGGAMRSTGGYELSGTIGQPDAGHSASASFNLSGGFWFEHAPGDCVLDGAVTLYDVAAFEQCSAGPESPEVDSACTCMDFDGDSDVDLRDAAELQLVFSAP